MTGPTRHYYIKVEESNPVQTFPLGKVGAVFLGWGRGVGAFFLLQARTWQRKTHSCFRHLGGECEKADWDPPRGGLGSGTQRKPSLEIPLLSGGLGLKL